MAGFLPEPTNAFGVQQPALTPLAGAYAPQPTTAAPATVTAMRAPVPQPTNPLAAAGMAGIQAGQVGAQATDTKTGVISTLGGAAAGAIAGSAAGPLGAAAGGVIGGGLAALNAWMSVGKENQARRDQREIIAQAKAEQARRDKIARDDALDGLAYERRAVEEEKKLQEWQRSRGLIAEARAKSKARKEEFINQGFVA